jgi:Family of unknown function (DUF6445)
MLLFRSCSPPDIAHRRRASFLYHPSLLLHNARANDFVELPMRFNPNPHLAWRVAPAGREQNPVLIVDQFMQDAQALIEAAERCAFVDIGPTYPGVRAPAPDAYAEATLNILGDLIAQVFGASCLEWDLCAFSMVTTPAAALTPLQRVPHFDGPEAERVAFLHYLCGPPHGGTSFYRHRATGFESVDASRMSAYRAALRAELAGAQAPEPGYAGANTALFERIGGCEAIFNRAIVYRGNTFHSGDILAGAPHIEDARRGRLTINAFGLTTG